MKVPALGALSLALLFCCAGCGGGGSSSGNSSAPDGGGTAGSPVPRVFWVSQPVEPDETMLITGGDLDAKTLMELAQLPDGEPGSPVASSTSKPSWTKPAVLASSARSFSAVVPSTWNGGVYLLRLSNGSSQGSTRLINGPDPWFAQGDQGDTAQPGGSFTVAGTCLERPGGLAPQAALVKNGALIATLPVQERITTSLGYGLSFAVPATVPEGEYEFYLHNGRGGSAAWVKFSTFITAELGTVTVRKVSPWPSTKIDVSTQSGADDDARFANAIAAVPAAGGRIFVPAGTYNLTTQLVLPPHTVLAGAGRTSTLLQWSADPGVALVVGKNLQTGIPDRGTFAIEDLSLQVSGDFLGHVVERTFTRELGWIKRVGILAPALWNGTAGPTALFLRNANNTQLEELVLDADTCIFAREGVTYLRLLNSTLNWRNTNMTISARSHNLLVAGNTLNQRGTSITNGWAAMINPNPGMWYSSFYGDPWFGGPYTRDMLWTGNTSTRDETEIPPGYVGYTSDGGTGIYLGGIASASDTTLNLAGSTDKPTDPSGNPLAFSWIGGIVQILDGRGAGQWRYLTEAGPGVSTVQVDRPWDIAPDGTSTVSVANLQGRLLMIDNDFAQEPLNQDYFLALDSIKAGNKFGVNGTSTTVISWTGKHYLGTFPAWHYQFLGNQILRGTNTNLISAVQVATPGYTGVVGSGHVYRNTTNTSGSTSTLRLGSLQGPFADAVLERNQVDTVSFGKTGDSINLSGVLVRGNLTPGGSGSAVQPAGTISGVTVVTP